MHGLTPSALGVSERPTSPIPLATLIGRLQGLAFPLTVPPDPEKNEFVTSASSNSNPNCPHTYMTHRRYWLEMKPAPAVAIQRTVLIETTRQINGVHETPTVRSQTVTIPAGQTASNSFDVITTLTVDVAAKDSRYEYMQERLLPQITEIAEKDQLWNKAPSPKRPSYYAVTDPDGPLENAEEHYRRLYVAVERTSGKAELLVRGTGGGRVGSTNVLVCAEDNGTIIDSFAELTTEGIADLSFTPTGLVNDKIYKIRVGVDRNGSGTLTSDELQPIPEGEFPLTVRVVTQESMQVSYTALLITAQVGGPLGDYINTFLNGNLSLNHATANPWKIIAIGSDHPTMIAGSSYNQSTGETSVRSFHLADGTTASNLMEANFSTQADRGLHKLVRDIWTSHVQDFWLALRDQPGVEQTFNYVITGGAEVNFYYADNFHPLRLTYGRASCKEGSVTFVLRCEGAKVIAKRISVAATIEDLYDFDFTRPPGSPSRRGAILQIGWEPPQRNAGCVFHSEVDVNVTYTESSTYPDKPKPIEFFNTQGHIDNGQITPPGTPPGGGGGGQ